MSGSRNRTVWKCLACRVKFYKRRGWAEHLWAKHHVAVLRKVRRPQAANQEDHRCLESQHPKPRGPDDPSRILKARSMK